MKLTLNNGLPRRIFFNEMSDIIIKGAKILEYLKTNGNTKLKGAPQNKVEDNEYKKTKQLSFVFNSNETINRKRYLMNGV